MIQSKILKILYTGVHHQKQKRRFLIFDRVYSGIHGQGPVGPGDGQIS